VPTHVLITGAAGAIGGSLAESFRRAYPETHLSLIDLNQSAVEERAASLGPKTSSACWDLSKPEELASPWSILTSTHGSVDVLINCAGVMEIKTFASTGWELGSKLLAINLLSPLRLMDLAIGQMQEGTIINVCSMAGKVPIRGCTYYGAAKSGLAMASEIANLEGKTRGLHIITVYPGPVYSALESHARSQVETSVISRYIPTGQPADIAARILDAYQKKQARVIYPTIYQAAYHFLGVASWFTSKFSPTPNK
jgi:short-subunit dehydrogenase